MEDDLDMNGRKTITEFLEILGIKEKIEETTDKLHQAVNILAFNDLFKKMTNERQKEVALAFKNKNLTIDLMKKIRSDFLPTDAEIIYMKVLKNQLNDYLNKISSYLNPEVIKKAKDFIDKK